MRTWLLHKKERLKAINKKLTLLSLSFAEHVLKEENRFELVVDDRADSTGLPEGVIAAADEAAADADTRASGSSRSTSRA